MPAVHRCHDFIHKAIEAHHFPQARGALARQAFVEWSQQLLHYRPSSCVLFLKNLQLIYFLPLFRPRLLVY